MDLKLFDVTRFPAGLTLHPKFQILQSLPSEQSILEEWVKGFTDRDGKFVTEFQSTFHSTLFEIYLYAVLKSQRMTIDLTHSRPDFLVTDPSPIVIEAVTAGIKKGGRPESDRGLDDILSMFTPPWKNPEFDTSVDEGIVRYSNAICKKALKYKDSYSKLPWVSLQAPYVIAMGSFAQVNFGSEFHWAIVPLLFGRKFDVIDRCFKKAETVKKDGNGPPIDLNLFAKEEFRHVSAVLFTCTLTLGKLCSMSISAGNPSMNQVLLLRLDNEPPLFKMQAISPDTPEDLFDGLFVLHNPNAEFPLPASFFADTTAIHIRQVEDGLTFEGGNLPVVARLNLSRAHATPDVMRMLALGAMLEYNDDFE